MNSLRSYVNRIIIKVNKQIQVKPLVTDYHHQVAATESDEHHQQPADAAVKTAGKLTSSGKQSQPRHEQSAWIQNGEPGQNQARCLSKFTQPFRVEPSL